MRAFAYTKDLFAHDKTSLKEMDLPEPNARARDLIVEVKSVSVNPVDSKLRMGVEPGDTPKVLGFDASGVVKTVGPEVTLFAPGDEVFYAGAIDRPGTNSVLHAVDERIVGRKPKSLSHAEAAALPLTTITAWELLFDRFGVAPGGGAGESLLVIGGAGGVGSILTQLARQRTDLTVVATASRPETQDWVKSMGAHHVVNHRNDLADEMSKLGLTPRYVAGLTATEQHFPSIVKLLAPHGHFGLIDDPDHKAINISLMKQKALSFHWELMFTRSLFETDDMIEQHRLLNQAADLVDKGRLKTTLNHDGGPMNVDNLRAAFERQNSGKAIGKTVLSF